MVELAELIGRALFTIGGWLIVHILSPWGFAVSLMGGVILVYSLGLL